MLFIGQLLFAGVAGLYSLWLTRALMLVVWRNGLEGKVTTSEEALQVAAVPLGKLFDFCITRPLDKLLKHFC